MIKLKAYAKINLSLKISGRRPDGYHELESVMQSVSLFDLISLDLISFGIQLSNSDPQLPIDNRNLAYKAAELFLGRESRVVGHESKISGVNIHIKKSIPIAAGLAGGSADAAAVLCGLNQLAGNPLPLPELMALGAAIGSDVPFCLTGGNCTVRGRGEVVERNPLGSDRHYTIVVPEVEVSTAWAYKEFDKYFSEAPQLIAGKPNYLEPAVIKKYPVIQAIKEKLLELGCSSAQMSGSGASVFGEVDSRAQGEKIVSQISREYARAFLVQTVGQGIEEY